MSYGKVKTLLMACAFIFLIFSNVFAAEYTVPRAAYSVYADDLDLDGDNDIVVGHNFCSQTAWSGVSILRNNGDGVFTLSDSVFIFGWQPDIKIKNINTSEYSEIIAKYENMQEQNEYIAIINNFNLNDISYFSLNTYEGVESITTGDIDGDDDADIILASNSGQFWGVMYNGGTGQFSVPEYHSTTDYYPSDIACGNLNEDDRNDIVLCGQQVEVYFSYDTGFESLLLDDQCLRSINLADMDNDGDKDIIALDDLSLIGITVIRIYENKGSSIFSTHADFVFRPGSTSFELADFNRDSLPDIVCTNSSYDSLYILYNQGNYNLSASQSVFVPNLDAYSRKSFCADLDGNGYPDIITIRYLHGVLPANLNILFNDGQGNFVNEPQVGIVDNVQCTIDNLQLTNYPNPFNNSTLISFTLPKAENVKVMVYNSKGELVKKLVNATQPAGTHNILFKADGLNSGVYFYRLETPTEIITKKIMLIK